MYNASFLTLFFCQNSALSQIARVFKVLGSNLSKGFYVLCTIAVFSLNEQIVEE